MIIALQNFAVFCQNIFCHLVLFENQMNAEHSDINIPKVVSLPLKSL